MKLRRLSGICALVVATAPLLTGSARAVPSRAETVSAGNPASRVPRMVILIRHAEKPPKEARSPDLTAAGRERAQRLPALFLPAAGQPQRLPRPDVLFATRASHSSNREVETLEPLAHALHLSLNDTYSETEENKLAADLLSGRYAGKIVMVCWHHGRLPQLAEALGVTAPPAWPDSSFDRIWRIEWVDGQARMTDLSEQLMPGDSQ